MKFVNIFPSQNNSLFSLQELKYTYEVLEEKIEIDFIESLNVKVYPGYYSAVINNWNKIILVPTAENITKLQVESMKNSLKKYLKKEIKNISKPNKNLQHENGSKDNSRATMLFNYCFKYSKFLDENTVVLVDRSDILKEIFSNRNLIKYESWVGFDTSFVIKTGLNVFTNTYNLSTYSSIIVRL